MARQVKGPREVFVIVGTRHHHFDAFRRRDDSFDTCIGEEIVRYIRADLAQPAKKTTAKRKKKGGSK